MVKTELRWRLVSAGLLSSVFFVAPVSPTQGPEVASPKVASSPTRPALLVGVAIDGAGLSRADLKKSLDLVLSVFDRLPPGSEMVIGTFSRDNRILLPPTADRKALAALLDRFKAGASEVALPDGLFDMVGYLAGRDASARSLLLVSGGAEREGDLQFEDPLNAATSKGIPIVALGLGQGDGKQLRRVAKLTGGDFVRLEVADAAMLARSLVPQVSRVTASASPPPEGGGGPSVEAAPATTPEPPASGGLLGAAVVLLGGGGLLIFGVIVLMLRRMSSRPIVAATPVETPRAVIPKPTPAQAPPFQVDDALPIVVDDFSLERTLVVNANPILRALSGPGAGKNFPLSAGGSTSLGRSRRNTIVVPEDAASAQHCRIDRESDSYVLYDLGATNGTWVNGAKTQRAVLAHGDRLKVGDTVFTVGLFGDRS